MIDSIFKACIAKNGVFEYIEIAGEGILASREELARAYDGTIEGWGNALNLKDNQVEKHSHRVIEMTLQIAKK